MTLINPPPPCLLCDAPTAVSEEAYRAQGEAPFVLCIDCNKAAVAGTISWPMVKMIYVLRCQVSELQKKVHVLEDGMRSLLAKPV